MIKINDSRPHPKGFHDTRTAWISYSLHIMLSLGLGFLVDILDEVKEALYSFLPKICIRVGTGFC